MSQNVYAKITDRIVSALREGVVPWHQPWNAAQGRPRNLISGKPYRGINLFLLLHLNEGSPFWLTYRQALQIGGHVKKGAKGQTVIFWKFFARKGGAQDGQQDGQPDRKERGGFAMERAYTVFNATQCVLPEAWAEKAQVVVPEMDPAHKIAACEKIVADMPGRPAITHGGGDAFYQQSVDQVTMPEPGRFEAPELYYSILFHELTHATGHAGRLNRATLVDALRFGDTNYSKEELVAEMGAAFLCGVAGIENRTIDGSAGYVHGWLKKLRHDTRLLVQAASQAQRAADYILGLDSQHPE